MLFKRGGFSYRHAFFVELATAFKEKIAKVKNSVGLGLLNDSAYATLTGRDFQQVAYTA